MSIFDYIKAEPFFRDYLPHIKNFKRKISGKNGRGNPVDFTEEERREILEVMDKLNNKEQSKYKK